MGSITQFIADLGAARSDKRLAAAENLAHLADGAQEAAVALVHAVADEDDEVREAVVAALEDLGPPKAAHVQELTPLVVDANADVGYWAATLLGRLGEEAAPAIATLTAALAAPAPLVVRQRAAWALGNIGAAAASSKPALEAAAKQGDARLARLAHQAIEQISGK